MIAYPAIFEYDYEDNVYNLRIPDLPGCLTYGETIDEAKKMARQALTGGKELLQSNPDTISVKLLSRYDEFVSFKTAHRTKDIEDIQEEKSDEFGTPEEALEYGYQKIISNLSEEILSAVKNCSPQFFEKLVVDLLVQMGYGGSRKEAGEVLGRSGDGGIDGIIKEDKHGLDIIYIQRNDGTMWSEDRKSKNSPVPC